MLPWYERLVIVPPLVDSGELDELRFRAGEYRSVRPIVYIVKEFKKIKNTRKVGKATNPDVRGLFDHVIDSFFRFRKTLS